MIVLSYSRINHLKFLFLSSNWSVITFKPRLFCWKRSFNWFSIIGHSKKCFSFWTLPRSQRSLSSFFHFIKFLLVLATPILSRLSIFHVSYFRFCPGSRLSTARIHIGLLVRNVFLSFRIFCLFSFCNH